MSAAISPKESIYLTYPELDVRYVKLHFTVELTEDTVMPVYKASAIRGGLGEMLLRANCIKDRNCESCDFESECIVRRLMYPRMEIQPDYMTSGESLGFVTECEDYRENLNKGDQIRFNLLLFGKTIIYFSQILNAIYALGQAGIGKFLSTFEIISITNTKGEELLDGGNVYMDRYQVITLGDYVEYRKKGLVRHSGETEIKFQTPLTLKFRGEPLQSFSVEPVYEASCRRLYSLACLEGIETDIRSRDRGELPEIIGEEHKQISVRRYSNHQESAMYLKGIEGSLKISEIPDWMRDVLLAGELVHIGKNTGFGFGRYRVGI